MALVLADRVLETTTTAGSGTITLAGAGTGYQSFAVVGDGNTTYYTITDGTNWEVGIGTYTASGTTLSRDTVLSSSAGGDKVTFPIGVKNVFVDYPAGRAVYGGETGTVTISSLAATSAVITNLAATSSNITTLSSGSANITQLQSTSATITTLTGTNWTATSLTLTNALKVAEGGTGLDTTPTNGQLLIGNGTGFALSTLTAGSGISVTNAAGSITIANTSTGGAQDYIVQSYGIV